MKFHWKDPLEPTLKICPKCGERLVQTSSMDGWMTPGYYYCKKCGYKGSVYLEVDVDQYAERLKHDNEGNAGATSDDRTRE